MSSAALSFPRTLRLARLQWTAWLGLVAIALLDAVWANVIGVHLVIGWRPCEMPALLAVTAITLHALGLKRPALIAEYLALSVAMAAVFTVLCYLAFGSSGALVDGQLLAADRALGFDWLSGFHFIATHPLLSRALEWLYESLNLQVLYLCVLLGLMEREQTLREMFWLIFVSAAITNAIAIAMPAYGPFEAFGLQSHGAFLPDMHRLKSGQDMAFVLSRMTGVISFPSFHTVMALSYAWCLRRTGIIGYLFASMNFAMLFSIPYFGGHYLVDIIAGVGVMLLSLGIVKAFAARRELFGLLNRRLALG